VARSSTRRRPLFLQPRLGRPLAPRASASSTERTPSPMYIVLRVCLLFLALGAFPVFLYAAFGYLPPSGLFSRECFCQNRDACFFVNAVRPRKEALECQHSIIADMLHAEPAPHTSRRSARIMRTRARVSCPGRVETSPVPSRTNQPASSGTHFRVHIEGRQNNR